MSGFVKAEKKKLKLRLCIDGPSGSGKTWGALTLATSMGGKIAVIDTEHGSASLYSDKFDFDVLELTDNFSPESYISAIKLAEDSGYDIIVIDSMSHEWEGPGGCLAINTQLGGRYTDWAKVTPRHDAFVQAILKSKCHVIATCRTKAEYIIEKNQNGKDAPKKVGTAPKQRDGLEYEFSVVFNLNQQHMASVSKDRTSIFDGRDFVIDSKAGSDLMSWLDSGVDDIEKFTKQINEQTDIKAIGDVLKLAPVFLHPTLIPVATKRKEAILAESKKPEAA